MTEIDELILIVEKKLNAYYDAQCTQSERQEIMNWLMDFQVDSCSWKVYMHFLDSQNLQHKMAAVCELNTKIQRCWDTLNEEQKRNVIQILMRHFNVVNTKFILRPLGIAIANVLILSPSHLWDSAIEDLWNTINASSNDPKALWIIFISSLCNRLDSNQHSQLPQSALVTFKNYFFSILGTFIAQLNLFLREENQEIVKESLKCLSEIFQIKLVPIDEYLEKTVDSVLSIVQSCEYFLDEATQLLCVIVQIETFDRHQSAFYNTLTNLINTVTLVLQYWLPSYEENENKITILTSILSAVAESHAGLLSKNYQLSLKYTQVALEIIKLPQWHSSLDHAQVFWEEFIESILDEDIEIYTPTLETLFDICFELLVERKKFDKLETCLSAILGQLSSCIRQKYIAKIYDIFTITSRQLYELPADVNSTYVQDLNARMELAILCLMNVQNFRLIEECVLNIVEIISFLPRSSVSLVNKSFLLLEKLAPILPNNEKIVNIVLRLILPSLSNLELEEGAASVLHVVCCQCASTMILHFHAILQSVNLSTMQPKSQCLVINGIAYLCTFLKDYQEALTLLQSVTCPHFEVLNEFLKQDSIAQDACNRAANALDVLKSVLVVPSKSSSEDTRKASRITNYQAASGSAFEKQYAWAEKILNSFIEMCFPYIQKMTENYTQREGHLSKCIVSFIEQIVEILNEFLFNLYLNKILGLLHVLYGNQLQINAMEIYRRILMKLHYLESCYCSAQGTRQSLQILTLASYQWDKIKQHISDSYSRLAELTLYAMKSNECHRAFLPEIFSSIYLLCVEPTCSLLPMVFFCHDVSGELLEYALDHAFDLTNMQIKIFKKVVQAFYCQYKMEDYVSASRIGPWNVFKINFLKKLVKKFLVALSGFGNRSQVEEFADFLSTLRRYFPTEVTTELNIFVNSAEPLSFGHSERMMQLKNSVKREILAKKKISKQLINTYYDECSKLR